MSVICKAVEVNVRSADLVNHTIDADVSSESIDRDGEIILLSSWQKRLAGYMANPLLCWMHPLGSWGARQPEDILGRALVAEVQPTSLFCRFQYAVDINPKARMCFDLIAGGYLRSYSIGAIPHGPVYSDYPEVYLNLLPDAARAALKSGEAWCVHTDMELLEVSNVFVGSNREGLARACRDGVISKGLMPDIYKQISAKSGSLWQVPLALRLEREPDPETKDAGEVEGDPGKGACCPTCGQPTEPTEPESTCPTCGQTIECESPAPPETPEVADRSICPLELVKAAILKL